MVKDSWSDEMAGIRGRELSEVCLCVAVGHAGKSLGGTWVKSLLLHFLVCNSGPVTSVAGVHFLSGNAAVLQDTFRAVTPKESFLSHRKSSKP